MEMGSAGSAFLKMARRRRVRHKPCREEDGQREPKRVCVCVCGLKLTPCVVMIEHAHGMKWA